ncbi:MAG: DUF92 domain-containing protein [Natronomonas sp.]
MTGSGRAAAFVVVGGLTLLGPVVEGTLEGGLKAVVALPFLAVAAVGLLTTSGPLFELFARKADRDAGRLYGLAGFALGVAGLGVIAALGSLPMSMFTAAVFVVTVGNGVQMLLSGRFSERLFVDTAFVVAGSLGGIGGFAAAGALGAAVPAIPTVVFVSVGGGLVGGLLRSLLFLHDDPLVVLSVGLVGWFLLGIGVEPTVTHLTAGIALTAILGYVAHALDTASSTGVLTGVLLALFTVILGGYGWFLLLVTFFGLGGLSSKYRYEQKLERGIAEENEGERGTGNVLANSAVALVAVVGFATVDGAVPETLFQFAFAAAVAAALSDTFSSEFGGLFDNPRLITTGERVPAGTDGGVTWQGGVFGLLGAGIIGGLAAIVFGFDTTSTGLVVLAGFFGMVFDSVLGATLEDGLLDNQSVNLLATLAAALLAVVGFTIGLV